ncbi:MAG TPA: colicin D domain-containing protein [Acidisarcina sp.]
MDKLQHIYDKHAGDFGLFENKNLEQLHKLKEAIDAHLVDPETVLVRGQYRGSDAGLYFNLRTEIVVVLDDNNNVMAGFRASETQAGYILARGRLN